MAEQIEVIDEPARALPSVVVEDKGDVFNSDLTQAIELGCLLDVAACMLAGRDRAQGEPRRALAPARLPDPRRRELPQALDLRWRGRRPASSATRKCRMTKWTPEERKYYVQVALKIWRYDATTGDKALREYEVDAPEEATLLDVLDIVKDHHDGTLAYRKSCRMMICGSCGMRMDGAAVLACKTRMYDDREGGPRARDLADGQPAGGQGPRRRHGSLLGEVQRVEPYLQPGYASRADGKEHRDLAGADERRSTRSRSASTAAAASPSATRWSRPGVPRAAGAREGDALRRRPARRRQDRAARDATTASTGSGSARAATSATSAARRASTRATRSRSSAPSRSRRASTTTWARSTRSGSSPPRRRPGWLRETELVPKTQGIVEAIRQTKFALGLLKHGKVPPPFPPHVAEDVKESRALHDLVKSRAATGAPGSSRASGRSRSSSTASRPSARHVRRAGSRRGGPQREVPSA